MKRFLLLLTLFSPAFLGAQTLELGARASVGADYKLSKGLHLTVEEELRVDNNFASLDRLQTTVGLDYKINDYLKVGAAYALLNPYKPSTGAFNAPRHRVYGSVTGSVSLGDFQFSLRERLQLTHRGGTYNVYQNTPNELVLKSRLTVKYKGWKSVTPAIFGEVRNQLNDPWGEVSSTDVKYKKDGTPYYDFKFTGYTHAYVSRIRAGVNLDWKLSKAHILTPQVMLDYVNSYVLDVNGDGTRMFSAAYENGLRLSFCLAYTYKF